MPASKKRTPRRPATLHVIVLAAGQGTRMKSDLPKVLHPVGGRPMLGHVLDTALALKPRAIQVVVGHGSDPVRTWVDAAYPADVGIRWVRQPKQQGTAHAVKLALPKIPVSACVLVLYGDVPLVPAELLQRLRRASQAGLGVGVAEPPDPTGYGRILRDAAGDVIGIVEEKDASAAQRRLREVHTGFIAVGAKQLRGWLSRVRNRNAKREYYLTDIVALAAKDGAAIRTAAADPALVEGVNDRVQLGRIERVFQRRQAKALQSRGVTVCDAARLDIRGRVKAGRDCELEVGVILEGEVSLGDRVRIGPHCVLRNVTIGAGTAVEAHSILDGVRTGRNCRIGPFARLRPDTKLADAVHIGNFVEVKKTTLGRGSKANHLAYLGDGEVGAAVNVGAGTILCNYDGAAKHRTVIGDDVFIGSDTQLVAPVTVGKGATIAAGSTITRDVPAGGLTVCRAQGQRHHAHWRRPRRK